MSYVRAIGTAEFARIQPGGFAILWAITSVASKLTARLDITCGTDSHPDTDPHYRGEAYDVSVQGFTGDQILSICEALKTALGDKFTILYETPTEAQRLLPESGAANPFYWTDPAATGPHIHIQVAIGQTYP